jgi:hypothetical protein
MDTNIDPQIQKELNTPLADPSGVNAEDAKFLESVISLINEGKINLYNPDTLINHSFYDTLSSQNKGKADLEAFNVLTSLREIKGLFDAGYRDTYQMQNLVESVRHVKERIEADCGDIFII